MSDHTIPQPHPSLKGLHQAIENLNNQRHSREGGNPEDGCYSGSLFLGPRLALRALGDDALGGCLHGLCGPWIVWELKLLAMTD